MRRQLMQELRSLRGWISQAISWSSGTSSSSVGRTTFSSRDAGRQLTALCVMRSALLPLTPFRWTFSMSAFFQKNEGNGRTLIST